MTTPEEGGKVLEFPTKVKKRKKDDGRDINIGCAGSGCLFWPFMLVLVLVLFRGLTFGGHHYYLSINAAHGLELHDDHIGPEDEAP